MTPEASDAANAEPVINDIERVDDHIWPLKRAAKLGSIAVAVILVASLAFWGAIADLPGLYGALIGGTIGGGFMLATVVTTLATANTNPQVTLGVVLGSWLFKAVVVLLIILALKTQTFYDKPALAVTVILSLIAALSMETYAVTRGQRLYVG